MSNNTPSDDRDALYDYLRNQGVNLFGITSPNLPPRYTDRFHSWLDRGGHADMHYLSRRAENNVTPESLLPGIRSIIVLGFNYFFDPAANDHSPSGKISRYACFRDYHKSIGSILKNTRAFIDNELGGNSRGFVDTSPLLERAFAEQAGLGYIGSSGMLITRTYGTWVFLGLVLTTLELPFSEPADYNFCGSCTRCIDACPPQALLGDGTLDSEKCISYQTIENRGDIPAEMAPHCGDMLFGCDICQTVCPHNSRQTSHDRLPDFQALRFPSATVPLDKAIQTNEEFLEQFAGTPVTRTKLSGFRRNREVVLKNLDKANN